MSRHQRGRHSPERSYRRESGRSSRYSSEEAPRNAREDDRGDRDDAGYGSEWPESYHSDFSGEAPQRYRDSWSERQSGPYRSSLSGRPLSEDDYRQESRYYRSSPYTGSASQEGGRVQPTGAEKSSAANRSDS